MSRDSRMGLPPSKVSITANSRARSCMSLAMRKMYFARSDAFIWDHTSTYAFRAALTAKSTSDSDAQAMSANFSSFAGFTLAK